MRRKSLVVVGICVLGLCGCSKVTVDQVEDETIIYDTEEEIVDDDELSEQDSVIEPEALDSARVEPDTTLQWEQPDMKSAYEHIINVFAQETPSTTYDLIYLDEDTIPELVASVEGECVVSVFGYQDGMIIPIMDKWIYGGGGIMPFEYVEKAGIVHENWCDMTGSSSSDTYYKVTDQKKLELIYTINSQSEGESENPDAQWKYYYSEPGSQESKEISKEEFDSYSYSNQNLQTIGGKYEKEEALEKIRDLDS